MDDPAFVARDDWKGGWPPSSWSTKLSTLPPILRRWCRTANHVLAEGSAIAHYLLTQNIRRPTLFTVLELLPAVSLAVVLNLLFIVMISGTMLVDVDASHGAMLLSRYAVVSFEGLIEDTTPPAVATDLSSSSSLHPTDITNAPAAAAAPYMLTFHFHLNAFGWEWPSSRTLDSSTGLLYNINGLVQSTQLSIPRHLVHAGRRLDPHVCDNPDDADRCWAPFFYQFRHHGPDGTGVDWKRQSFSTALPLALHYLAFVLCAVALARDLALVTLPPLPPFPWLHHQREREAGGGGGIGIGVGVGGGESPATAAIITTTVALEAEAQAHEARRKRAGLYAAIAAVVVLALASLAGEGLRLVALLQMLPESERMRPRLGSGFVALALWCCGLAVAAAGMTWLLHWERERGRARDGRFGWVLPVKEKEDG